MLYIGKMHGLNKLVLKDMEEGLSEDSFFPPPNLEILEYSGKCGDNNITVNLSEELCSHLKGIKSLTIAHAKELQLSNGLETLENLEEVNFSSLSAIKGFENIGKLSWLTRLSLVDDRLTTLPAEIGQLTQLTKLDLVNNQLTTLPAEIGQLTQLTKLGLSNNQLSELPAQIGNMTQLTELDLSNNRLTTLPAEIGQYDSVN